MALTATQKADIARALGWSDRFKQTDTRLESSFTTLGPETELHLTDTLANNGILANISDIQTKLRDAHKRLKARKSGALVLNQQEVIQLRSEGNRWVKDLARRLGVEVRDGGVFGGAWKPTFAGAGGNYVGK